MTSLLEASARVKLETRAPKESGERYDRPGVAALQRRAGTDASEATLCFLVRAALGVIGRSWG